ncbi:MAG: hypothetical protein AAF367_01775 [Pseudomonadota bacterium]
MFDFDGDAYGLWIAIAIIVACIIVGVVVGGVYGGEIGAAVGGIAGAFVGGGVLYAISRAFDAAVRNYAIVAPAILIIAGAIWLYTQFS